MSGAPYHRTPSDHDSREPYRWPQLLQNDVRRHVEQRIREEKHRQAQVVLVIGELEVFHQAFNLGIADTALTSQRISTLWRRVDRLTSLYRGMRGDTKPSELVSVEYQSFD